MSLQTGYEIARTSTPIIDPRSLNIVAFYVTGAQVEDSPAILHTEDIREAGELGFIIDDSSKLMGLDGLVRLQEIIHFGFDLMKCDVYQKSGKKIGQVSDYSFDPNSFAVQQIYAHGSLLKSFTTTSHIINRTQIISIDNRRIVVDTPDVKETATENEPASTAFVNPFRAARPQPEPVDTSDTSS